MQRTRALGMSFLRGRGPVLQALAAVFLVVAGCGGDGPTDTGPVDPGLAAPAAEQAATLGRVVAGEALLDGVSDPFTSAAGDPQELGELEIDPGFDDYPHAGAIVARAFRSLQPGAGLGAAAPHLRRAVVSKSSGRLPGIADACSTTQLLDGELTVCVAPTDTVDVVRITITRTATSGPVQRVEQRFLVHDGGTPLQPDDDRTMRLESEVTSSDGTLVTMVILPTAGEFILDHTRVEVEQSIQPAAGPLLVQSAHFSMDVGLVETDGDEVYFAMTVEMLYRDGASAGMTVREEPEDGLTSGDQVLVRAEFVAAPGHPRLERITTELDVLLHDLRDPLDDQVTRLARQAVFDGRTVGGGEPTSTTVYVPAAPVSAGEEPCGGHFERHAVFPAAWDTRRLDQTIDVECGVGGTAVLDLVFADGSEAHRIIGWDAAGNATIEATRRDGTTVEGSFDAGSHSFEIDTTFPPGNDPVSMHQAGDAGLGTRDYLVVVVHADSSQDSLAVHGTDTGDGTRRLTGWATDRRGRVDFQVDVDLRHRTLEGSASGPDDETLVFALAALEEEEGAQLDFTFEDPSAHLVVVGDILLEGDGSGCGTLTVTQGRRSATLPVCFEPDGDGTIGDGVVF